LLRVDERRLRKKERKKEKKIEREGKKKKDEKKKNNKITLCEQRMARKRVGYGSQNGLPFPVRPRRP